MARKLMSNTQAAKALQAEIRKLERKLSALQAKHGDAQ